MPQPTTPQPPMEAVLAERGQIVIPKAARDALGLTPGMKLDVRVEGGKIILRKKVDDAISRARGRLKLDPATDLDATVRERRGGGA